MNKVIQAKRKLIRQWWKQTYNTVLKNVPLHELTPRSKAVVVSPKLRLPRHKKRKPFPIHKARIQFEVQSEPGMYNEIINALETAHSNS